MKSLTEKSYNFTNLLPALQNHETMGLMALTTPKVNTATVVVLHDRVTLEEKSEKQDLSGWHRSSCSSNCLESLAEAKTETG